MEQGNKGLPFVHNGTKVISDAKSVQEAVEIGELNFKVDIKPAYAKLDTIDYDYNVGDRIITERETLIELKDTNVVYRKDTNTPLGVVGNKYNIVQNIDAFDFFNYAIDTKQARFVTSGMYGDGEKVFLSAKLNNVIEVGGKDNVDMYCLIVTSHNGTTGVKVILTPIRVACLNILSTAIENSCMNISFRHTKNVNDKIDMCKDTLHKLNKDISYLKEIYDNMLKGVVIDTKASEYFTKLILNKEEMERLTLAGGSSSSIIIGNYDIIEEANISSKKVNTIRAINEYYHKRNDQKDFIGTKWGVYNAVTGYYSNIDNTNGIQRMDSLIFGDRSRKIAEMSRMLVAA